MEVGVGGPHFVALLTTSKFNRNRTQKLSREKLRRGHQFRAKRNRAIPPAKSASYHSLPPIISTYIDAAGSLKEAHSIQCFKVHFRVATSHFATDCLHSSQRS